MDVITIESEAFNELKSKIEYLATFVRKRESEYENLIKNAFREQEHEVLFDTREVASMLRISTRTLQRLRTSRRISFSMIGKQCLYKKSEIERALNEKIISCSQEAIEEFRNNYLNYAIKHAE